MHYNPFINNKQEDKKHYKLLTVELLPIVQEITYDNQYSHYIVSPRLRLAHELLIKKKL